MTIDSTTQVLGWLGFNAMFLTVIVTNICILVLLSHFPIPTLIYGLLPYYSYGAFFAKSQFTGTAHWPYFSKNFFVFPPLRRFLQLQYQAPKTLTKAASNDQYMIAAFPHGVASDFRILMDGMLHDVLPFSQNIRTLAASVLFLIPVARELSLWTGCVDARRTAAQKILQKGHSLLILPGGEAEQLRTEFGKEQVYLRKRKGFIKLAIREGVPIVPCYVFGASDYYKTSSAFAEPRSWLVKKLGVCLPLAIGLWGSIFCPFPVATTVVFGEPLAPHAKDQKNPTDEEIVALHEKFMVALQQLFDTNKGKLGYLDRNLVIT